MYCEHCGTKLSEHARFCPTCGRATSEQPPADGQDSASASDATSCPQADTPRKAIGKPAVIAISAVVFALIAAGATAAAIGRCGARARAGTRSRTGARAHARQPRRRGANRPASSHRRLSLACRRFRQAQQGRPSFQTPLREFDGHSQLSYGLGEQRLFERLLRLFRFERR